MKILHVITLSELGGAQSVVINIANRLSREHEVIVAAGAGDGKMWEMFNDMVKFEKVPFLQRDLSPVKELKCLFALRSLYKKHNPDIIHLHSSKAGLLGRLVFPSRKIVYTIHGFDSIRIAHRKFLPLEKILQKSCGAIVGVSHYDERNLLAEGISHNVSTIYNGIEIPVKLLDNPFMEFDIRRKKVICIARLSPPKNYPLFVEVAGLLPQYDFIWIGNQSDPDFPYPSNAYFLGSIPFAASYIEYADVLMLPSNYEGLPMAIIEAMSLGKPIVASNVGGISEIVRDGENGYTLDNNAESFATKINMILKNKELYNSFAQASSEIYQKELTVDIMVEAYLGVYTNIVSNHNIGVVEK